MDIFVNNAFSPVYIHNYIYIFVIGVVRYILMCDAANTFETTVAV